MSQNFNNLSLTHSSANNDEFGCRSSINQSNNNHRSKTGNKNSFTLLTHVDVHLALSDDQFECANDEFLLAISPHANNCIPVQSNVSISISPASSSLLTTSKSENNIFDKNLSSESPSHFNVVSLSDLSDDAKYSNTPNAENEHHYMNDLSKTQVLNHLPGVEEKLKNGKIVNRF